MQRVEALLVLFLIFVVLTGGICLLWWMTSEGLLENIWKRLVTREPPRLSPEGRRRMEERDRRLADAQRQRRSEIERELHRRQ